MSLSYDRGSLEINSTNSNSYNLNNELKMSIEKRRETINFFRNTFLNKLNSNNREILIDRYNLEDLLSEFEFTISQSLQAIKTLEVENSNLKEIYHNRGSLNQDNRFKNNSTNLALNLNYNESKEYSGKYNYDSNRQNENEIANYKFQSPTNNDNIQFINRHEEISFSPDTNRENTQESFKEDSNSNFYQMSMQYNYNYKNYQENNLDDFNNNYMNYNQIFSGLNLNFDYSKIKYFNDLLSTNATNSSPYSPETHVSKSYHSQGQTQLSHYTSNSVKEEESNQGMRNFTFEGGNDQNKENSKYLTQTEQSIQNMIKHEEVYEKPIIQINNFNLKSKSKMNYKFDDTIESEPERENNLKINDLITNNNNSYPNYTERIKTIEKPETPKMIEKIPPLTNEYLSEPNIRVGLRQKIIQNKVSGQSTGQNSPKKLQNNSHTIDVFRDQIGLNNIIDKGNKYMTVNVNENDRKISIYNTEYKRNKTTIESSDRKVEKTPSQFLNEQIDTETSLPSINSKRSAFNNRLSEMEKEIIINNILKRINRVEGSKQLLAGKYSKGSYDNFLKKLMNSELIFEEVENDLKYIQEENEKRGRRKISNTSNTNSTLTYNHSAKNLKPPEYGLDSENNRKSSSRKGKNNSINNKSDTVYVEPVNFETFLRKSKKPIVKKQNSQKNTSSRGFGNSFSKSRPSSRDKKRPINVFYN